VAAQSTEGRVNDRASGLLIFGLEILEAGLVAHQLDNAEPHVLLLSGVYSRWSESLLLTRESFLDSVDKGVEDAGPWLLLLCLDLLGEEGVFLDEFLLILQVDHVVLVFLDRKVDPVDVVQQNELLEFLLGLAQIH